MNRKAVLLGGLGVAGGLVLLYFVARKTIVRFDLATKIHLARLKAPFRQKVEAFIASAHAKGIDLRITSSERDCAKQTKLYNQGRTTPGNIVTNAKCGQSSHNYGLAVDVVEYKDNKPVWNNPRWEEIASIGEAAGLEWGGRWKSFIDKPHFQDLQGKPIAARYKEYQNSGYLAFYQPDPPK